MADGKQFNWIRRTIAYIAIMVAAVILVLGLFEAQQITQRSYLETKARLDTEMHVRATMSALGIDPP